MDTDAPTISPTGADRAILGSGGPYRVCAVARIALLAVACTALLAVA